MSGSKQAKNDRWPRQIGYIVGNEAAERFSYYGMKSILALYITHGLVQSENRSTTIIHLFGFVNYFMPLLGGWLSDRLWGRYHTILWVSLLYCAGHGVLATSDLFITNEAKLICLYIGLGLIAAGAGGIKPCVSAFMGDQFDAEQGHLMRKAYGAFYFSINFGSFFAYLIIPWIAARPEALAANAGLLDGLLWQFKQAGFSGYSWAFGVPGIVMALATLIFWLGTKHYVRHLPARKSRAVGFFSVFFVALRNLKRGDATLTLNAAAIVLTTILLPVLIIAGMAFVAFRHDITIFVRWVGWGSLMCFAVWYVLLVGLSVLKRTDLPDAFWDGARSRFNDSEIAAARSVAPILTVLALIPAFWALFEQSSSTWVLQGAQMEPFTIFGLTIRAEQMQSANPLFVMILVPALTWGVYPVLETAGLRISALRRISVGLILAAASYLVVGWLQHQIDANQETVSLAWQALPYLILTTAEVLVSTTGLEFAYTQAAPSMKGAIMSFWFLTMALGNLLVTTITQIGGQAGGNESVTPERFFLYAGIAAGVALLFMIVASCHRERQFHEVAHSKSRSD